MDLNLAAEVRIRAARIAAWPALAVERCITELLPLLPAFAIFCALSVLSFWNFLPNFVHFVAMFALAAFSAWKIYNAGIRTLKITKGAALSYLEERSGMLRGAFRALGDKPEAGSEALWKQHKIMLKDQVKKAKVIFPAIKSDKNFDSYALTNFALVIIVLGAIVHGRESLTTIRQGFVTSTSLKIFPSPKVSGWIKPPAYTHMKEISIFSKDEPITVPDGSVLTVQTEGFLLPPRVIGGGGIQQLRSSENGTYSAKLTLHEGDEISVGSFLGFNQATQEIKVVKDAAPVIKLLEKPTLTRQNSVKLVYTLAEDYGIKSLTLSANAITPDRHGSKPSATVKLPANENHSGELKMTSYIDLKAGKWVGKTVQINLGAEDETGQTGALEKTTIDIPEIDFRNPFAQKVNWQRKLLLKDLETAREPVAENVEALSRMIGEYRAEKTVFLALRVAAYRLMWEREENAIDSTADLLWDAAMRVEFGRGGDADQALDKAFSDLLSKMAGGEMDMRDFKRALSKLAQKIASKMSQTDITYVDPANIPPQLMKQLGSIEEALMQAANLFASGDKESARKLLEALRKAIEDVDKNPANPLEEQQMLDAMNKLQDLKQAAKEQQELADEMFKKKSESNFTDEEKKQSELLDKTSKLKNDIEKSALGQCNKLGDAMGQMSKSRGEMKDGDGEGAAKSAQKAADAMRDALGDKQRQFSQKYGNEFFMQGFGNAQGNDGSGARPMGEVKIPERGRLEKSREILEELYKRARDKNRSSTELDYINRLLEQF